MFDWSRMAPQMESVVHSVDSRAYRWLLWTHRPFHRRSGFCSTLAHNTNNDAIVEQYFHLRWNRIFEELDMSVTQRARWRTGVSYYSHRLSSKRSEFLDFYGRKMPILTDQTHDMYERQIHLERPKSMWDADQRCHSGSEMIYSVLAEETLISK